MEYIQKLVQRFITMVMNSGMGIFGEMKWQRAIGPEQAKILDVKLQPSRLCIPLHAINIVQGKVQTGLLPKPHRLVFGTQRFAKTRQSAALILQITQEGIKIGRPVKLEISVHDLQHGPRARTC